MHWTPSAVQSFYTGCQRIWQEWGRPPSQRSDRWCVAPPSEIPTVPSSYWWSLMDSRSASRPASCHTGWERWDKGWRHGLGRSGKAVSTFTKLNISEPQYNNNYFVLGIYYDCSISSQVSGQCMHFICQVTAYFVCKVHCPFVALPVCI